jgi:RNA polymerase sigma-70 factor, ECF subfamily
MIHDRVIANIVTGLRLALALQPSRKSSFEGCLLEMPGDHDADDLINIGGLYNYALVLTRNQAEAEDLVQETYVRAMRALGCLRAGSNLKAWLFTILRNAWLNQVRKQRLGPQFVGITDFDSIADAVGEPSKDAHDIYVSKTETRRVRAAIQKLPIEYREIILLREYEDLSYREIAAVLECPAGTVMSRLARARTQLRTLLSEAPEMSERTPVRDADKGLKRRACKQRMMAPTRLTTSQTN